MNKIFIAIKCAVVTNLTFTWLFMHRFIFLHIEVTVNKPQICITVACTSAVSTWNDQEVYVIVMGLVLVTIFDDNHWFFLKVHTAVCFGVGVGLGGHMITAKSCYSYFPNKNFSCKFLLSLLFSWRMHCLCLLEMTNNLLMETNMDEEVQSISEVCLSIA